MMKVFLGWSGERSQALANAIYEWLPNVIQAIKPWMSEMDINKGARWFSEISENLKSSQLGIICLTPENLGEPWIHFEAGALAGNLPLIEDNKLLCTYLFQVESSDIKPPLSEFNHTKANKDDTLKLMHTINKVLMQKNKDLALTEKKLDEQFEMWWPRFEEKIKLIESSPEKKVSREPLELIPEILESVRNIERKTVVKIREIERDASGNIVRLIERDASGNEYIPEYMRGVLAAAYESEKDRKPTLGRKSLFEF